MTVLRDTAARPSDLPGLAAGLVTVTAWGSAFVAIRAAADELSPGALALGGSSSRLSSSRPSRSCAGSPYRSVETWSRSRSSGSWLGVYSTTLNAAEHRVDAGTAAMLINTGPILIAILAGLVLHEGFPPRLFAGCAVAFAGTVLIGIGSARSEGSSLLGVALCLVAAAAYAVAVVVQKPVLARVSSLQVTWLACIAATLACLPFAPRLATETAAGGASAVGWVIYLGLVPTALGFVSWAFALNRTSAGRMAALAYLIPVVAVVLGWALLDEVPARLAVVGGVLCLAGVYLARRRA